MKTITLNDDDYYLLIFAFSVARGASPNPVVALNIGDLAQRILNRLPDGTLPDSTRVA